MFSQNEWKGSNVVDMSHLENFRREMIADGWDAAIVSSPVNQRYLSAFSFEDGLILITKKDAYLLTDFRYAEAARAQVSPEWQIRLPQNGHLMEAADLLAQNGCKTVAIEETFLPFAQYERYCSVLEPVKVAAGASAILSRLRIFKDSLELETISRAQKITDDAFTHILSVITPNMTEAEVALELEFFMRKNGAEGVAFDTIAVSGSNSSRPHGVPRHKKLEKGFLTMDFGARVDGYCSDMTRTVVLGRADAEMKKLYRTVLDAQTAALDAAEEGISCRKLDAVARDIINGAGYDGCFGHSLGHGVGLYIHENPRLSPAAKETEKLCRGHVVTVEPGIYLEGKYGCRIEDMIAVRPDDGKIYRFTQSPKELIELF